MGRVDGALARRLDFEEAVAAPPTRRELRLAALSQRRESKGPVPSERRESKDKYKALEHRRRQAQIKARRLLDLVD